VTSPLSPASPRASPPVDQLIRLEDAVVPRAAASPQVVDPPIRLEEDAVSRAAVSPQVVDQPIRLGDEDVTRAASSQVVYQQIRLEDDAIPRAAASPQVVHQPIRLEDDAAPRAASSPQAVDKPNFRLEDAVPRAAASPQVVDQQTRLEDHAVPRPAASPQVGQSPVSGSTALLQAAESPACAGTPKRSTATRLRCLDPLSPKSPAPRTVGQLSLSPSDKARSRLLFGWHRAGPLSTLAPNQIESLASNDPPCAAGAPNQIESLVPNDPPCAARAPNQVESLASNDPPCAAGAPASGPDGLPPLILPRAKRRRLLAVDPNRGDRGPSPSISLRHCPNAGQISSEAPLGRCPDSAQIPSEAPLGHCPDSAQISSEAPLGHNAELVQIVSETSLGTRPRRQSLAMRSPSPLVELPLGIFASPKPSDQHSGHDDGLRRSKRARTQPLAHWLNETVVYERLPGSSMPSIRGVLFVGRRASNASAPRLSTASASSASDCTPGKRGPSPARRRLSTKSPISVDDRTSCSGGPSPTVRRLSIGSSASAENQSPNYRLRQRAGEKTSPEASPDVRNSSNMGRSPVLAEASPTVGGGRGSSKGRRPRAEKTIDRKDNHCIASGAIHTGAGSSSKSPQRQDRQKINRTPGRGSSSRGPSKHDHHSNRSKPGGGTPRSGERRDGQGNKSSGKRRAGGGTGSSRQAQQSSRGGRGSKGDERRSTGAVH